MLRPSSYVVTAVMLLIPCAAAADDRSDCAAGDNRACARLGELKQQGALNVDGTKNQDALIDACGKALETATGPRALSTVSHACRQLFNRKLQKSWDALAPMDIPQVDLLLGTAYAEAYCPVLKTKVIGCKEKKAANFSNMSSAEARAAIKALNAAALNKELGTQRGAALAAKFDQAWSNILGPQR